MTSLVLSVRVGKLVAACAVDNLLHRNLSQKYERA